MPPALIALAGTAISGASGGGGKKGPSGQTTTTQAPNQAVQNLIGRINAGIDIGTGPGGNLGTNYPGLSDDTTTAQNMVRNIAQSGGGGDAVRNATQFASGLIGDPTHSSSIIGQSLTPWASGNFSNSPGYSGLLKTANGEFLPGAMRSEERRVGKECRL